MHIRPELLSSCPLCSQRPGWSASESASHPVERDSGFEARTSMRPLRRATANGMRMFSGRSIRTTFFAVVVQSLTSIAKPEESMNDSPEQSISMANPAIRMRHEVVWAAHPSRVIEESLTEGPQIGY